MMQVNDSKMWLANNKAYHMHAGNFRVIHVNRQAFPKEVAFWLILLV